MKTKKPVFVLLLGPTCVGKGFEGKLITRSLTGIVQKGLRVETISFGQLIRDKLSADPEFRKQYGHIVGKGGLLENDKAISLFAEAYETICLSGEPDIVFIDGFCRSTEQIRWATENGFLTENDIVFIFEACLQTCLDRFIHRNASGDSPQRTDSELKTFYSRWHLHADTIPDLRALLAETGPEIVDVDANKPIAEFAHPVVMSELIPVISDIMFAKNSACAPGVQAKG